MNMPNDIIEDEQSRWTILEMDNHQIAQESLESLEKRKRKRNIYWIPINQFFKKQNFSASFTILYRRQRNNFSNIPIPKSNGFTF